MATLAGNLARYPARTSLMWFSATLLIGTFLLWLPFCHRDANRPITLVDSLFTATSALCVTGLSVRSTANDFSWMGQLTILSLIQLGGIGIVSFTTLIMTQFRARSGLRQQATVTEALGATHSSNVRSIIAKVILLTVMIEAMGTVFLFPRFYHALESFPAALWASVFHSISAFCNAGFSLYDDSIERFCHDWLINIGLISLIIVGGIGFPVISDFFRCMGRGWLEGWNSLRLHSKVTIAMTVLLVVGGSIVLGVLESNGLLANRSTSERFLIPLFHSVSCRTAGFNSVNMAEFSNASLFVMILLMVIGAGACSTAGGIKVSTFALLLLHAAARFRGHKYVNLFHRTIPQSAIDRAMASAMLFLSLAAFAFTSLLVIEQKEHAQGMTGNMFLSMMFEVASALGTVGLSTGITPTLSSAGKIVLVLLMFIGRLGPISVFAALTLERKSQPVQYASDEPLVG